MSVNSLNTFLNVKDAHLRVVSGNVYATAMNIGGINVDVAHGLQSVTNQGNVTSNTLQFSNATTGFVTTANITVGRDLTVTGNALVSSNLTVTGNVTVSDDLTVTENLLVSNNLTVAKDVTVTGNTFYTSPMSISVDSNVVAEYTGPHERPLRKYPEVAMTVNSDKGYVAIGSSNGSGSYPEYTAFDGVVTNSTTGWASDGTYASGTGISTFSWNGSFGEYLSLELPKALRLQKMFLKGYEHSGLDYQNAPRDIKLYGSNNETNWVLLKTETDLPIDSITSNSTYININATEHYKYIRLQITKTYRRLASYTRISELEYYGHEEGSGSLDTTLKSVYNVPATTGTQLEVYYDGRETSSYPGSGTTVTDLALPANNGTLNGGVGFDTEYKAFTFDGTDDYISATYPSVAGDNIITMSAWILATGTGSGGSAATALYLGNSYGSNSIGIDIYDNGTVYWYMAGGSYILFNSPKVPLNVKNQWFHVTGTYQTINSVIEMKFYVNGEDVSSYGTFVSNGSLSLVGNDTLYIGKRAGVTTINWNGSIANFRLYSKALNAGQVQELYDYQKDYFLGSKSQVTLYKGHLGVGVTEPSSQLELAGDARIQEYPPRDLGGFETMIEGEGTYKVSSSNDVKNPDLGDGTTSGTTTDHPAIAFTANGTFFRGVNGAYNTSSVPALYTGTHFTNGIGGDFIQIELPHKIYLKSINITSRTSLSSYYDRGPHTGFIFGSNNGGTTWSQVASWVGLNWTLGESKPIQINSNALYSTYRLVANKLPNNTSAGASRFNIDRWRLFGTPGPTTLDKGSLTLGRSLDVPRISRYDVDTETPRPEKLVVDFDTTVNSSPTDISGKGNHGVFYGSASYSAADKAFDIAGTPAGSAAPSTSAYLEMGPISSFSGNQAHTISLWFKKTNVSQPYSLVNMWKADTNYTTIGHHSGIFVFSNGKFQFWHYGGDAIYTDPVGDTSYGGWRHVVGVYTGTTVADQKLYVNGIEATLSSYGSGNGSETIDITNATITLGKDHNRGSYYNQANTEFSNPKIYSVALEPSEVKKLYNLGRTGRSMVISDTAVGIGKVPEAQLDVRGNIKCDGVVRPYTCAFSAYASSGGDSSATGVFPADGVHFNIGNCYDASTYKFTAPVHGIYHMTWSAFTNAGATGSSRIFAYLNNNAIEQKGNTIEQHGNSLSLTVEMQAGDTFNFRGSGSYPLYYYGAGTHNRFSGHLICAL